LPALPLFLLSSSSWLNHLVLGHSIDLLHSHFNSNALLSIFAFLLWSF
jgi:hypothetical protein